MIGVSGHLEIEVLASFVVFVTPGKDALGKDRSRRSEDYRRTLRYFTLTHIHA